MGERESVANALLARITLSEAVIDAGIFSGLSR